MNFITQVTISIVIYFIIRIFNKSEKSLYISASFAGISYILIYLLNFEVITILPTIHFMVTGLSLLFLFIAYNEIIILERKMRKIKKGDFLNAELFPIEKNYKIKGLETPKIEVKFDLRASPTGMIQLDEVFVPNENVLEYAKGLKAPMTCLTAARYGIY